LVIVDSGDLLNEDEELPEEKSAKIKAELIAKVYKYIGVDAVNIGELDLVLGVSFLKQLEKTQAFPFISANLVDKKNLPIFKRYVIKKVNGKNVGIFGVMGDTSEMAAKVQEITKGAVSVTDPLVAANAVLKELAGKVDYVIALTHQGTNRDWVIARKVNGINLVVGGHDKQKTKEPNEADKAGGEKTLIVQAGEKGQYQGILEVTLDAAKTSKNTLFSLDENVANEPKVKQMITDYNDQLAGLFSTGEKPAASAVELRLTKCEPCHAEQVAKWKTTAHAKAYDTLVKKSKNFDPKCIMCHTTRYEKPGGFNMKLQQMELVNIQCESCHGNRDQHLTDMKPAAQKPDIALCITCHTSDRCPNFKRDEQKVMGLIKHWK
jgi:2',3'-cyclic-nucleotide 2'-phosphodiesterase (5'-nucleotidase family)